MRMKTEVALFCLFAVQGVFGATFYRCSWVTEASVDCDTFQDDVTCGTDGVTYRNKCEFSKAHCLNKALDLKHPGACSTAPGGTTVNPVAGGDVVFDFLCTSLSHKDCPTEVSKVCASDGRTYTNFCEYEKSKCTHRDLTLVTYGDCSLNP
ncbi:agrin-like [Mya arenaria]|uniref:agrin-like n=1 Tax=Mya arenaria TaxID=6604 RepID=UPI0022E0B0E1|nr:agrin-like [Mya arenaria]